MTVFVLTQLGFPVKMRSLSGETCTNVLLFCQSTSTQVKGVLEGADPDLSNAPVPRNRQLLLPILLEHNRSPQPESLNMAELSLLSSS